MKSKFYLMPNLCFPLAGSIVQKNKNRVRATIENICIAKFLRWLREAARATKYILRL